MKKIFFALIGCLTMVCARAAQIANIEYVHKMIEHKWDITVPYNPTLSNVKSMANMKYLLTAIDVANQILNGEKTTDYGNGEFATLQVADTTATNQAVETLIKQNQIEYKFSVTIDIEKANGGCLMFGGEKEMTSEHGISLSAAGTFYIDWGDGTTETIKKTDTESTEHLHDYGTKSGVFTIRIGGKATDYNDDGYAAIGFINGNSVCAIINDGISSIDGSLGAIFSTLPDGSQPRFFYLFEGCYSLTGTIPENLFDGIYGNLVDGMFSGTFSYCSRLTGPSVRINGQYLYEIWPDADWSQVGDMYTGASRLDDYVCIPTVWGGLGEYCESSPDIPAAPENATYDFYLTTTSDINVFSLSIGAAGEFYIDWGDGKTQLITKSDTGEELFTHQYNTAGAYTIGIGGQATAYNDDRSTAAISFSSSASKIASIDGSLGAIFGTLANGIYKQPRFYETFFAAYNMTGSIPENLFAGISGKPASYMFYRTFLGCSGLTSIPAGLFAGISGAPDWGMFFSTFSGCSGLTSIPENLFGNISGRAMSDMFTHTFADCTSLTSIPAGLFAGISGAPADSMFSSTFSGCTGLTSIPADLFAGISGAPADSMFSSTFSGCTGLTSIPAGLFAGISGAPTSSMFSSTFSGCTGLTSIPAGLFAGISGAPANSMFSSTFSGCTGLTSIPAGLFASISGAPANSMFIRTFEGCSGLTSIPENLFGNISGTAQTWMFYNTFYNCTSLTGPSARINGQYLYEIWPNATSSQVGDMYYEATGLSDYSSIPSNWK